MVEGEIENVSASSDETEISRLHNMSSNGDHFSATHKNEGKSEKMEVEEKDDDTTGIHTEDDTSVDIEVDDDTGIPIDEGYAWAIVAACFGMHILVVGGIKSFGVLFVEIQDTYDVTSRELGVAQGVTMTLMMGLGFVSNMLAAMFSCRVVVFTGGLLSSLGFLLTAFIPTYNWIYCTYCLITGVGFAMSYAPCVVMVGCHFRKYRSMANGIAVSGSGIGSFALPNLFRFLVEQYGLFGCLLILSAIMLNISVFGLLFRPLSSYSKVKKEKLLKKQQEPLTKTVDLESAGNNLFDCSVNETHLAAKENGGIFEEEYMEKKYDEPEQTTIPAPRAVADADQRDLSRYKRASNGDLVFASLQSLPQREMEKVSRSTWSRFKNWLCCSRSKQQDVTIFDWSLLRNPVWWVWGLACFLGNNGYPNVFIMLAPHVELLGESRNTSALLVSIIGLTDLTGRMFFGWLSDRNLFPRRYGFVGCMFVSGALLVLMPVFTSVPSLIFFALLYGFVAGSYIALVAVMLADSLGTERLGSSFGLVALMMAISTMISPPICGALKDATGQWNASFVMVGVTTVLGSLLPLLEPLAMRRSRS